MAKAKTTKKKRIEHDAVVRTFAERLRELRVQRGMSQLQLAQRAHVNISYVGRLERATAAPGIDLAGRLAQALSIPVEDLLRSPTPSDTLSFLQEQARRRFESILKRADAPALSTLNPWLTLLDEALIRSK